MDSIPFSTNWNNKLSCKYYTTIRLASPKYQIGKTMACTLKSKFIHHVIIQDLIFLKLDSLNQFIIGLDMGLELEVGKTILRKMYSTIDFNKVRLILVLCKVVEPLQHEIDKELEKNQVESISQLSITQVNTIVANLKKDEHHNHTLTETQIMHNYKLRQLQQIYRGHANNG